MEKTIDEFVIENEKQGHPISRVSLEIRHDLTIARLIARRKMTFMIVLGCLALVIFGIVIGGVTEFFDFTPAIFLLTVLHLGSMFALSDMMRTMHIDVLKSRLKYPEFYTDDGRFYKRILSHEAVLSESRPIHME